MNQDPSLERIIPDQLNEQDVFDQATLALHRARYAFAMEQGRPGRILDMACGSGYGVYQISGSEKFRDSHFIAVDNHPETIAYAKNRYARPSIEYICADALQYTDHELYDSIVSLETIEHLPDVEGFVQILYKLLKKDGILIVSAPVTPSTDGNPHHLSDFTRAGFKKIFEKKGFKIQAGLDQVQPYGFFSLFRPDNQRIRQSRQNLWRFYQQHPGVFLARVRSLISDGLKNRYLTLALQKI